MKVSYWLIGATCLMIQFALQAWFFPLSALAGQSRLNYIDAPFHQYQVELAHELCQEHRATGYDPRFAGGHIGGVTFNASAKLPALLACLGVGDGDSAIVYKQVSFWSGVIAPALLVLACAALLLSPATTAFTALLGLLLWWTGALRWYHTAGMVSFVFIAYASIAFVAGFVMLIQRLTPWRILTLGLAAAGAFFVHPLFIVAATLMGASWLTAQTCNDGQWLTRVTGLVLVAAMLLGLNWFWLQPSLSTPSFANMVSPYQREIDPLLFVRELLGTAPTAAGGSRLYAALLLGAILCIALYRGEQRRAMLGLCAGAACLMAWASMGSLSTAIALTQPNRFSAVAWLVLSLPASVGIVSAWRHARRRTDWTRGVTYLLCAATVLPIAFFIREALLEAMGPPGSPRYGAQYPEVRGVGPIEEQIVGFLKTNTDDSARVLFENSLGRVHDGGHVAGLIAWRSGRELIGGPYPFANVVSAWDGFLLGRAPNKHSPESLLQWLTVYNIRWMLCHTSGCKDAMAALPGVRRLKEIGPVTAFGLPTSSGFVAQGAGSVSARCGNRVELDDVAQGGPLVLRYQWVPGVRAVPTGQVRPVQLLAGTPPFIAVDGAPPAFALRVGDGEGVPCAPRVGQLPP